MRSPYFPKPAELQEGPRQGRCPGAAGARDRADPEGQEERAPLQGRALDPSSSRENPSVPGVLFGPALPGALRPHASTHHSSRFFFICAIFCAIAAAHGLGGAPAAAAGVAGRRSWHGRGRPGGHTADHRQRDGAASNGPVHHGAATGTAKDRRGCHGPRRKDAPRSDDAIPETPLH